MKQHYAERDWAAEGADPADLNMEYYEEGDKIIDKWLSALGLPNSEWLESEGFWDHIGLEDRLKGVSDMISNSEELTEKVKTLEHGLDCYKSDMRQLEGDARRYVARYEKAELRLAEIETEYAEHRKIADGEITERGKRISELEAVGQFSDARQVRLETELDSALKAVDKAEAKYKKYTQEINEKLASLDQELREVLQIVKGRAE